MDPKAIEKARRRHRVAEESAEGLSAAKTYEAFADKWYVFLHAAKGVYTTLEQGAKATPQARQWFGAKNQERKADPLLRYISEARNDDEHGLEGTTEFVPQALTLGARGGPGHSTVMRDQWGNTFVNCGAAWEIRGSHEGMELPRLTALDGKPIRNVFTPARIVLKDVRDRSNVAYAPPQSHLGKDLETGDPFEVAKLTLAYLSQLIEQAAGLNKP